MRRPPEEPLLETRQRPALDGDEQDQSAQQVAEVAMTPSGRRTSLARKR